MTEEKGIPASSGYAVAKAYVYRHDAVSVIHEKIAAGEREKEMKRLDDALASASSYISSLISSAIGESERALYSVELLMLSDPEYIKAIKNLIDSSFYPAEWAVESATATFVDALEKLSDEYMKERAVEIKDIANLLLELLNGKSRKGIKLEEDSILIADYLLTSEFLSIEGYPYLKGLVLDVGGKTSHVSILARNRGIPAVVGIKNFAQGVQDGILVAIDGSSGAVIVDPSRKVIYQMMDQKIKDEEKEKRLYQTVKGPSVTKDGKRILLKTNVEGLDGIEPTVSAAAEGIGLFRTEFLVLEKGFSSSDDREFVYEETARLMKDNGKVTFRTLDIGGDKIVKDSNSFEQNPILGWRAIRFSLSHKEIFLNQIKRILKASKYKNVRIMFPLISSIDELDEALSVLQEARRELDEEGVEYDRDIEVGTMIEVPSAAITCDLILEKVDFISVGTNDLIQYTLAVDRGNEKVSYLYQPMHPAILRLLNYVVRTCHEKGKIASICGEMAGDEKYLPLLVGLGFDELSVSPPRILPIRAELRKLSSDDCRTLLNEVLSMSSHKEIEKRLKEFRDERRTGDKE